MLTLSVLIQDDTGHVITYEIPPPGNILYLPVVRLAGRIGTVVAYWEVEPVSADFQDFSPASGNITFQNDQVGMMHLCPFSSYIFYCN